MPALVEAVGVDILSSCRSLRLPCHFRWRAPPTCSLGRGTHMLSCLIGLSVLLLKKQCLHVHVCSCVLTCVCVCLCVLCACASMCIHPYVGACLCMFVEVCELVGVYGYMYIYMYIYEYVSVESLAQAKRRLSQARRQLRDPSRASNSAFNASAARVHVAEKANMFSGGDIVSKVICGAREIHGIVRRGVGRRFSQPRWGRTRCISARGDRAGLRATLERLSAVANALRHMTLRVRGTSVCIRAARHRLRLPLHPSARAWPR